MEDSFAISQQKSLLNKIQNLNSLVPKDKKDIFHLKSIDNFARHWMEIKDNNDRIWIYSVLEDYINICLEELHTLDRNTSKELYNTYILKVGTYYDHNIGFSIFMHIWIVFVMYIGLFFLGLIWLNFFVSLSIFLPLCILHVIYLNRKQKLNRTFGIFH